MSNKAKKIIILVMVLVLAGSGGAIYLTAKENGSSDVNLDSIPTAEVRRGNLTINVSESGTINARDQVILKNEVEGRRSILYLVDEGKEVEEGELLVELDDSTLRDEVREDEIDVQNAEAAHVQARENLAVVKNQAEADLAQAELDLQFAKQDLEKYKEGEYPNQLREAESQITLAKEELERATNQADWSDTLFEEKYISQTELESDRLAQQSAQLDYELAVADLELLKKYTYERQIAQLESDVEQAKLALDRVKRSTRSDIVQAEANLKAAEAELEEDKRRLEDEKEQIEKTKIHAPVDGMVIYATSVGGGWRGNDEPLQEGQEVREREELIYLPTADSMMAEAKIHESHLEKIETGLPVKLTVEALQGREYSGKVTKIAPLPDSQSIWLNPDLKVYNTQISIDSNPGGRLRTGMSCQVEIIVEQYDDATYVPVQSIVRENNRHVAYVIEDGRMNRRPVEIGMDNNQFVRILDGLEEGEVVSMAPPLSDDDDDEEEGAGDDEEEGPQLAEADEDSQSENTGAQGEGGENRQQMSEEDREEMRERIENMSDEEREQMRENFRSNQGSGTQSGG